jgi:hypothetical protein
MIGVALAIIAAGLALLAINYPSRVMGSALGFFFGLAATLVGVGWLAALLLGAT